MDAYILEFLKSSNIDLKPQFRAKFSSPEHHVSSGDVHPTYLSFATLEIARDLRESICRMSDHPVSEGDSKFATLPSVPYELPDGTVIDVGAERFLVPEIVCDTVPIGLSHNTHLSQLGWWSTNVSISKDSIPRMVCDSALRCDGDSQSMLLANLIITGGGSSLEGLPERLKQEVENIIHTTAPGWRVKSVAASSNERVLCPWIGGSILASLGSFHDMWVSRQEYNEFGSSIVDRKCP